MIAGPDRRRAGAALVAALAAVALAACGSEDDPAPVAGSPEKPLKAKPTEEAVPEGSAGAPKPDVGFKQLVDRQTDSPERRQSVCNLVTRKEAGRIVGKPLRQLVEAPQGPTCIYRGEGAFVTVSIQAQSYRALRESLRKREPVDVGDGRRAVCSPAGRQLIVALPDSKVLSVGADCSTATRFAARALPRLRR